jgi:hypothetical protein
MAKDPSFDVVSKVDMQELDNAVNQTKKEITQRFDFRGSKSEIKIEGDDVKILTEDDFRLKSIIDVLQSKLIKRGISIKNLDYGKVEDASGGMVRQSIKIKQGIDTELAKKMIKDLKGTKIKVQAQIMDDQIRVSGKSRDDLQGVIAFFREQDYDIDLQFTNYR